MCLPLHHCRPPGDTHRQLPFEAGGVKNLFWLWNAPRPPRLPENPPREEIFCDTLSGRFGWGIPSWGTTSLLSAATKSSTCIDGGLLVFCFLWRKISWGRMPCPNPPRPRPRGGGTTWARLAGSMYSDFPLLRQNGKTFQISSENVMIHLYNTKNGISLFPASTYRNCSSNITFCDNITNYQVCLFVNKTNNIF